jgi:hypothetical protein
MENQAAWHAASTNTQSYYVSVVSSPRCRYRRHRYSFLSSSVWLETFHHPKRIQACNNDQKCPQSVMIFLIILTPGNKIATANRRSRLMTAFTSVSRFIFKYEYVLLMSLVIRFCFPTRRFEKSTD